MEATLLRNNDTDQQLAVYLYGDCNTDIYVVLTDTLADPTYAISLYLQKQYGETLKEGRIVRFPRTLLAPLIASPRSTCHTAICIFTAESHERLYEISYLLASAAYNQEHEDTTTQETHVSHYSEQKERTDMTTPTLYIVQEGDDIYGQYFVPVVAQKHLVAIHTRWPESRARIVAEMVTQIDNQRIMVEGWRVGVNPDSPVREQAQEMGMTTLHYAKIEQITVTPQGTLVGKTRIEGQSHTVVYHALTLTWYLQAALQDYHEHATGR